MFVQFTLDSPLLDRAVSAVPDISLDIEKLDSSPTVPLRVVFWARSESFDEFEDALALDSTVEEYTVLATEHSKRLYSVVVPEHVPCVELYARSVDLHGVVIGASCNSAGWTMEMLFPDRDAFSSFRHACEEADLSVTVGSIHSGQVDRTTADADLTPPQREILSRAVEVGYFDIPRETTLRGLGDEVGVSGQAASERLRRGMETLVRESLTDHLDHEE
ncbi:helix-turn-helix domain-containing protein [Haloarchaeobius litoreus]|uniref:Helix-turn-helix domain-containing protein n=1 Tax=Haloarchaeobius litoreus TaxID=755306 RepID=A0ABD6DCV2_9EURY|nr:helix-turn-helix domain-containing protein [Haloarchaeobius litoreus]